MTALLAAASASWLPTAAPAMPAGADISIGQLFFNLLIVCGVLALLAWGAMAFLRGRMALPVGLRAKAIRVEDRLPIDPARALLVVSIGKRRWLVGMTNYSFNPIAELEPGVDFQQALDIEVTA